MSIDKKTKKVSFGIILCREKHGIVQALLVKARTTFLYREFVYGRYNPCDSVTVLKMLDRMSVHEKLLLKSLNFNLIWWHIWLELPIRDENTSMYTFYTKCKAKFERFTGKDNGTHLKALIIESTSRGTSWGIPAGRPNPSEKDTECALRELYEEANVKPSTVVIINNDTMTSTFDTKTCTYISKFYVAYSTEDVSEGVSFKNESQSKEIASTKWVSLKQLRTIYYHMGNLKLLLSKAFKQFKLVKVVKQKKEIPLIQQEA